MDGLGWGKGGAVEMTVELRSYQSEDVEIRALKGAGCSEDSFM